jgi:hypothetical protein
VAPFTVNEAAYDPAASEAASDTVRVPLFVPFRGDTDNQEAVGVLTDHFRAPLPALRMVTVWDGSVVPAVP